MCVARAPRPRNSPSAIAFAQAVTPHYQSHTDKVGRELARDVTEGLTEQSPATP